MLPWSNGGSLQNCWRVLFAGRVRWRHFKLQYAAFHLLPYHPHTKISICITDITGLTDEELDLFEAEEDMEQSDEEDEGAVQDD